MADAVGTVDGTAGTLFKDARLLLRLSLSKVSRASGVDSAILSRFENGLLALPPETIGRLRACLVTSALAQQAAHAKTSQRAVVEVAGH